MKKIRIKSIELSSLFKFSIISVGSFIIPFFVLMGILSLFGFETIVYRGDALIGVLGIVTSFFMGIICTILISMFFSFSCFAGLKILRKYRPKYVLELMGDTE